MKTILLFGFERFGSHPANPSGEIAARLSRHRAGDVRVEAIVLPVVRARALPAALAAIEEIGPGAVLGLGLAADRQELNVEVCARNLDDFQSADEAGEQVRSIPVVTGGPPELQATLPVGDLVSSIRALGLPAAESRDAGAFLCNHVYFGLLHAALRKAPAPRYRCAFLHLPGTDTIPLADSERAVRAALERIAEFL